MIFWADKLADEVIKREERLKRVKNLRVESGIGASGIPHLGSASDVARGWAVCLGIRDRGYDSDLIAFSDDRDGLRKVPLGFPESLKEYIGKPVSHIPDPFGCHESYGEHMSSLLLESLEKLGIDFKFYSGDRFYTKGELDREIGLALKEAERIKKVVKDWLGQDLRTVFFPICQSCGRIYTTRVTGWEPGKVFYVCDQEFEGKVSGKPFMVKGCGYQGECSFRDGKLAWKVEFAARWSRLKVCFEAYGKDLADSVRVNDWVSKNVFGWEPPLHARYELFLQKGGKKISKSVGNAITPQDWLRCGSPQSLNLLFFKRFTGTREIDLNSVPAYMDEVDWLEDVYFGREKIQNERELRHLKRLFEYIHYLKPPKKPGIHLPYLMLANILRMVPDLELAKKIVMELKGLDETEELEKRLRWAKNWVGERKAERPEIKPEELPALSELAEWLEKERDAEEIQGKVFELARKHGLKPSEFFQKLYLILLGSPYGPRMGKLIQLLGCKRVAEKLRESGPAGI